MKLIAFKKMTKSIFHSLVCHLMIWGILLTSIPQSAKAVYIYHTLPTQAQLPVAMVHCIFQDSEGFMWYGTMGGGLCRDNGYQVDVFRSDNRTPGLLLDNHVNCIAEDSIGGIWFGTDKRLYRLDKKSYLISEVMLRQEMRVITLCLDSHRKMWVGTSEGVYCINPADGKVLKHIGEKEIGAVYQILEDHRHRIWIVAKNGSPYIYDTHSCKLTKRPWALPAGIIRMIEDAAQQGFWVATWGEGVVFYDEEGKITPQSQTTVSADGTRCVDMLIDNTQGVVWVTTMDNLYMYRREGRQLIALDTSTFLPAGCKILDGLCEDRMGNVWVAGFTPHTFIISDTQQSIVRETVPAMNQLTGFPLLPDRMVADNDGNFWIWQGRIGLMHYEQATAKLISAGGMSIARGIAKDRNDSGIWVADNQTLKHLAYHAGKIQEIKLATFPTAINHIADNGNGTVWIGTKNAVYRYSTSTNMVKKIADSEAKVLSIAEGSDGSVYFVNDKKQLVCCKKGSAPKILENPHREDFTALAMAPDGILWCATQQGSVYSLSPDGNALEYKKQISNSNGDAIVDVKVDRVGHVWLLSNQYLREYNPRNDAFRTLRSTDPEIAVSYFYRLETVDDNKMAADGAGAYLQFESSKMLDQQTANRAHPYVTTVQMGDSILMCSTYQKELQIPSRVHNVILQCSTFDAVNANKVSFAYKVEGWNKEWVYLPEGVNSIYLNNLPKGKFRLLLRATDRYGCWSTQETEYVLHRLPAWWETWWAYLIYALLAITIVYGLGKLNRRIRLLMLLQQKRKAISLTEVQVKPEELAKGHEHTELFLKQVIEKIEAHLDDTSYGVEQLSSDMCMSRMSLYRKVQSMSGLSPNEFIRDIRLKKAAAILRRHPDIAISRLAEMVGFASPKYFSKCFKNKFGVQPSQYIKDKTTIETKITQT